MTRRQQLGVTYRVYSRNLYVCVSVCSFSTLSFSLSRSLSRNSQTTHSPLYVFFPFFPPYFNAPLSLSFFPLPLPPPLFSRSSTRQFPAPSSQLSRFFFLRSPTVLWQTTLCSLPVTMTTKVGGGGDGRGTQAHTRNHKCRYPDVSVARFNPPLFPSSTESRAN